MSDFIFLDSQITADDDCTTIWSPQLPVDPLAFKAEVVGSCITSYVGSPRDDGRGSVLWEPW